MCIPEFNIISLIHVVIFIILSNFGLNKCLKHVPFLIHMYLLFSTEKKFREAVQGQEGSFADHLSPLRTLLAIADVTGFTVVHRRATI